MSGRLLLVANWLHDVGGVQTATRGLAAALRERGYEVVLVSVLPPHSADGPSADVPTLYPRSALRFALEHGAVTTRFARLDAPSRIVAKARLRRLAHGARTVIAMDVYAAEIAAAATPSNIPVLVQFHNTVAALEGTRDLRRLQRVDRRIAGLVALTDLDAARFRSLGFARVTAIPNPIVALPTSDSDRQRLVVGIGRYTSVKRFELLIDAWAQVPSALKRDWRLELYGEGPERAALDRAAAAEPSVRIAGPTIDVADILRRASVLVLPSAFEGLPMVLLEAMSAGVPCIATRSSPGVVELLDGAGWLTPVDDKEALSAVIAQVIGDGGARSAAAERGTVRLERYAPSSVSETWEQLLRTVSAA